MPTIIKNGRNYSGTSVSLTQAEYDALPEVTKMNGTTYFITDSEVVLNAEDVALDEGNLNDLAGSVATIETSPATANHEVGEYILWNGVVYVVTSAIATGENLVINSNISARTIGSELTALNNGLSNLNSQISNMKVVMLNTGDMQYIDILFSETAAFFRIDCMNRRASAKPFSALVQKYSNTTNYVVNSNDTTDAGNFTCSNISGGIRVKMPFTYAYAMISGVVSFTVSAVS